MTLFQVSNQAFYVLSQSTMSDSIASYRFIVMYLFIYYVKCLKRTKIDEKEAILK